MEENKKYNILFIIKKEIYSSQEPLGILYLSSILKKYNHKVFISDFFFKRISQIIKEKDIQIVAFSCMNTDYMDYLHLSQSIKKNFPKILTVWGGPTPTYNPEIIEQNSIDIICRGEGEMAFLELIDKLNNNQNINDIPNFWIKQDSVIYKNDVRELISSLDILPYPDRSLLNVFPQFKYSPIKFVMASRGCPFNCSYCFNHNFHKLYQGKGDIIRTRSVDNLIEELEILKIDYKAKFFYFFDDIFPFQDNWLADFSEKYSRRINMPFSIITSANFINEKFIDYIKKAGCVSISLAIECGNEKIRTEILNKPTSNQQIIMASKLAKEKGLAICSYNMLGIPFSKFEDDLETLDLNLKTEVNSSYVFFCLPFLDTKLGKMTKDAGLISEDVKINSYYEKIPTKIENKEKIYKFSYFFPIIVVYPFLRRYLSVLLKMPMPKFILRLLKDIINGYSFKKKIIPMKISFKEFLVVTYSFLLKRFTK